MGRRPISASGRIAIVAALAAALSSSLATGGVSSGEVHPKDASAFDKKPRRSKHKKKFNDPHAYKKPHRHSR